LTSACGHTHTHNLSTVAITELLLTIPKLRITSMTIVMQQYAVDVKNYAFLARDAFIEQIITLLP